MSPFAEVQVEQGSDEWLQERIGNATASKFKDVLAKIKSGESAARRNYRAELVIEILTGQTPDRYKSKAMEWGNETEDLAATEFSLRSGLKLTKCGFFKHKKHAIGVSPDRIVAKEKACVEIKCYEPANHIAALRNNKMPAEHMAQVQGEIWATGSDYCYFVSYVPELPKNAQLYIERIDRDKQYIKMLEGELLTFLLEVEEEVRFIRDYGIPKKTTKRK